MSLSKSIPEGLKPQEFKRTKPREPPPVPYVHTKDEVQDYGPQTRLLERHRDKGSDYVRPMYANTPPQFNVARCKIGL